MPSETIIARQTTIVKYVTSRKGNWIVFTMLGKLSHQLGLAISRKRPRPVASNIPKPASLRVCVLLDKQGRREVQAEADFVGFKIPDKFVVGYGLDFAERYRNLPCIGVLKSELQNPPEWS